MMEERLNEYFSSLNFLCRNIISEKKNFESLLGQQWSTLPPNEQDALLNEHFIPPHVQQVYSGSEEGEEDIPDLYPRLRIKSGQKVVEDDEVCLPDKFASAIVPTIHSFTTLLFLDSIVSRVNYV